MNPLSEFSAIARGVLGVVMAVLLAGAAWKAYHWHSEHYVPRADYVALESNYKHAQDNEKNLQDDIEVQNDMIDKLHEDMDAQAKVAKQAQAVASKLRADGQAKADEIAKLKLTGVCEQDMQSMAQTVK